MSNAVVTLKKGEGRTLKAGGPWVYDNEVESIMGSFEDGDIVLVHDFDGYPMGRGFINRNSKLIVRMMTRDKDTEINEEFIRMRVKNAWEYRKKVVDTSSCRVIFGEADFLPGLVIDKYEDVLVVECLALGMEAFKEEIVGISLSSQRLHLNRIKKMYEDIISRGDCISVKDLDITGNDLMEYGLSGVQIGKTLNELLHIVIENPKLNEKSTLLAMIEHID